MPILFLLLGRWSFCSSSQHLRGNEVVMIPSTSCITSSMGSFSNMPNHAFYFNIIWWLSSLLFLSCCLVEMPLSHSQFPPASSHSLLWLMLILMWLYWLWGHQLEKFSPPQTLLQLILLLLLLIHLDILFNNHPFGTNSLLTSIFYFINNFKVFQVL